MTNAFKAKAYHGGASFEFIGPRFDNLSNVGKCINADVLDAWFDPSPLVVSKLREHLPWILRTSPPTHCEGLVEVLAERIGVSARNLLAGAGSSDLIFLAMQQLLNAQSKALTLDPTYGEYLHIFDQVVGCESVRVPLRYDPQGAYTLSISDVITAVRIERPNLVVIVNPNSPTGTFIRRAELEQLHAAIPKETLLWVDETYIDYVDSSQSMATYAADKSNVVVCKSLSKVYALSGARTAYLCSNSDLIDRLVPFSPPWAVGLPAQVATIAAMEDQKYYAERYRETHKYRQILASGLSQLGFKVHNSVANFLLVEMPEGSGVASNFVQRCRSLGLYLRDISSMGRNVNKHMIRVAVKDSATNERIVATINEVLVSRT